MRLDYGPWNNTPHESNLSCVGATAVADISHMRRALLQVPAGWPGSAVCVRQFRVAVVALQPQGSASASGGPRPTAG